MDRRSFLKACGCLAAGLGFGGKPLENPVLIARDLGGPVSDKWVRYCDEPVARAVLKCQAGEYIRRGDLVTFGEDGMAYRTEVSAWVCTEAECLRLSERRQDAGFWGLVTIRWQGPSKVVYYDVEGKADADENP